MRDDVIVYGDTSGDGDKPRCVTRLLGGVLSLHDVDDVEKLAGKALADQTRKIGARLRPEQREDLLTYLVGVAWELSQRYDPTRGRFSTVLYRTLRLRVVDWYRAEYGRSVWKFSGYIHERARPEFVELDERGLERIERKGTGDPASDRDPDLARIYAGGSRQRALDLYELGERPPRRVA